MIQLSSATIAICDKYYKKQPKCIGCPILPDCYRSIRPLTQENLDDHIIRLNQASKEYKDERK